MTQFEQKIQRERNRRAINQIDWEQRRYEIARDYLAAAEARGIGNTEARVNNAVYAADLLIKRLKNDLYTQHT